MGKVIAGFAAGVVFTVLAVLAFDSLPRSSSGLLDDNARLLPSLSDPVRDEEGFDGTQSSADVVPAGQSSEPVGVLVSLVPILGLKRLGIAASSRQASSRASMTQRVAGTVQLAIAAVTSAAAIAFGWHLSLLMFGDAGYVSSNRYLIEGSDFARNSLVDLTNRREAILAIPGVSAVAFGHPLPAGPSGVVHTARVSRPSDPGNPLEVSYGAVNRPFIELLGLRLRHGRAPEEDEPFGVVVVNQSLARTLWGHDDVVGERIPPDDFWGDEGAEVIGVLEDLSFEHPFATVPPQVFSVLASGIGGSALTVVEAQLTASALHQELDRLLSSGELEMTLDAVTPLSSLRDVMLANDRVRAYLTMGTTVVVLFMAAIGFYGIQRYLVAKGRREYAIRAALGAGPRALWRLVLTSGLIIAIPGLVVGSLLAFIATSWLQGDFVARQIPPAAITALTVIALLVLVLAASLGPALQAKETRLVPFLRQD